ncbi:hypothetical protein [Notoacmeibacter sp. MSK16QG-6]|uniref:hypothetical protein n=1 Tax=Notoacmeibacter sp. MSK16QG-6 TaxID=2957982 RepID=UPI00209D3465|nr:hypothetical protein [Notoacmeibacter sp. MSK16QG-6]MCP1199574.1 hypothetical protein [Notoacmeibacter sp. MSK16QG-6]
MALPPTMTAYCARHYEEPPQIEHDDGASTWVTRGVSLCVSVTQAKDGTILERTAEDQPEEYILILPEKVSASIEAGSEKVTAVADSLTIVPPGASRITVRGEGVVSRVFAVGALDMMAQAGNARDFAAGYETDVRQAEAWPDPPGGFRIRTYPLAKYVDPDGARIQPRVFRSTNMMINVFAPWHDRRDPKTLSPHWHDDFEQASLGISGEFVHHIRYPWESDSTRWHQDEHIEAKSPSVLIIPPPAQHTTQDVGPGIARLVDIFAPPRADFSQRPGFVLNESDYPAPDWVGDSKAASGGALAGWQKG